MLVAVSIPDYSGKQNIQLHASYNLLHTIIIISNGVIYVGFLFNPNLEVPLGVDSKLPSDSQDDNGVAPDCRKNHQMHVRFGDSK